MKNPSLPPEQVLRGDLAGWGRGAAVTRGSSCCTTWVDTGLGECELHLSVLVSPGWGGECTPLRRCVCECV